MTVHVTSCRFGVYIRCSWLKTASSSRRGRDLVMTSRLLQEALRHSTVDTLDKPQDAVDQGDSDDELVNVVRGLLIFHLFRSSRLLGFCTRDSFAVSSAITPTFAHQPRSCSSRCPWPIAPSKATINRPLARAPNRDYTACIRKPHYP